MNQIWTRYKETSLVLKITVALILGTLVGIVFDERIEPILQPFGDLMLRLLTFLILPLILFTLIVGINQTKMRDIGRMGSKVFVYYLITSAVAIVVGLGVSQIFSPGEGMTLDQGETIDVPEDPGIVNVILDIVPDNIVTAFNELNLLGIIFTAIVFGLAILALRSSDEHKEIGDHLHKVVVGLNEASFKIMDIILQYVPIGVFAIIATTVANQGLDTLISLGGFIGVLYIALFVQFLLYMVFMKLTRVDTKPFLKAARAPMLTAFVSQSSTGTLPLTIHAAQSLNLKKSLYSFSLPFGSTLNMDGAAIRIAVSAVFAANVVGDPLSLTQMLTVVIIGTLASVGTAGVPGAGIVMISTVFVQLGLPMEAVALLTAVDALVGMGCTALNVTGDLTGTCVINQTEKRAS